MKRCFYLYSRTNQVIIDGLIFASSLSASYVIRFEHLPSGSIAQQLLVWLPILVAARLLIHSWLGVYRFVWRFVSLVDAVAIARSLFVVTGLLLGLRLFWPGQALFAAWIRLPVSIIVLEYFLSLSGSLSARALRRILFERGKKTKITKGQPLQRVILYGAGRAGILLLREMNIRRGVEIVGFVDDDPKKVGTVISGMRVLGTGESVGILARRYQVHEIIITMATASRHTLMRILAECRHASIPAKIIPSLNEILEGRVRISQLREVNIEDLLGRRGIEVAQFDSDSRQLYQGKRILVTGAGGSIGSELVRQLITLRPSRIAILDKDENSIYELEQELLLHRSELRTESQIADIRNGERLRAIFRDFRPQIIFHAAAHKHVPLMEKHPCEAVLNNISGTKNVLDATHEIAAERFVFISTDKAVNPVNVMGATKRVGEMLVQMYTNGGPTRAACVRFGNVMGSRGSVIPLFQKQIANGGPITVTHADMMRFFMTIPEAVQLILCAGALANHAEVFVLDMGNPRNILELANEMILLSGLEPGLDIEIAITGLRPGEKLKEELATPTEELRRTQIEKLFVITPRPLDERQLQESIARLVDAARRSEPLEIYEILYHMGLSFCTATEMPRVVAASG